MISGRKSLRRACVFVVTALIALSTASGAAATTVHTPPYADVISGNWSDLIAEPAGDAAVLQLTAAGYHSFNDYNTTPYAAMGSGYAQDDAVWAMFGHGNAGYITTPTGVLRSNPNIDSPPASCSSPNACLSSYTLSQIHGIRMMMFGSCYSAVSRNGYLLPYVAVHDKGVDSSVGWSNEIYFPGPMSQWASSFFWDTGNQGYSMLNSAIWAESQVLSVYGSYYGTDTSVWYGLYNSSLKPAGYGN